MFSPTLRFWYQWQRYKCGHQIRKMSTATICGNWFILSHKSNEEMKKSTICQIGKDIWIWKGKSWRDFWLNSDRNDGLWWNWLHLLRKAFFLIFKYIQILDISKMSILIWSALRFFYCWKENKILKSVFNFFCDVILTTWFIRI